jgi:hypothetical protein
LFFRLCVHPFTSQFSRMVYSRHSTHPRCQVNQATKFCMMVAGSTVWNLLHVSVLCLAIKLVRISSIMKHLSPSCTDYHTSLHPNPLHQPYWLTLHYWEFSLPTSSLYKLQNGATGFLLDSWTLRMGPIGCTERW